MTRLPEQILKNPQQLASLLHALAMLLTEYGIAPEPEEPAIPASQSTLAPMDMATLHPAMKIAKTDDDEQLVFGWASVVATAAGQVVDSDGDVIEPAELEGAVYEYMLESRESNERHQGGPVGRIVESLVFTPEKARAMGIVDPHVTGWWVGVKVDDPEVYAKVKGGTYRMFSIEGTALVEPLEEAA